MSLVTDKPYMDSEPRYEDHPACFNSKLGYYWQAADVRQNAYWNLMAGVCGHTYGNHNIWCCNTDPGEYFPFHWREALTHPAAEQIRWLKKLRLRGDFASFRPASEVLVTQYDGESHLAAAAGKDYCYIYSPMGLPFSIQPASVAPLGHVLRAFWFTRETVKNIVSGFIRLRGEIHLYLQARERETTGF